MYQWDGTLSPSEFDISVADLCERWREVNTSLPQWVWLPDRAQGALSCDAVIHRAICFPLFVGPLIDPFHEGGFILAIHYRQQDT